MAVCGQKTAPPDDKRVMLDYQGGGTPGSAMHMPVNSPQVIADTDHFVEDVRQLHEAKWPQSARDEYKKSHPDNFAGPGTSFPIKDAEDVKHVATLYGHASHPDHVKNNIKRIAKNLGLSHALPDDWESDEAIREHCHILETVGTGHVVRVTVLKGGKSANGFYYDDETLHSIAHMMENKQAYADHCQPDQVVRSVRDLVGFYKNAKFIPATGSTPSHVEADLHVLESASWLWDLIQQALASGNPDLAGLSIDIFGSTEFNNALGAKQVTRVHALNSCDIVTRPSAGGTFQRILHHNIGEQAMSDVATLTPPVTPVEAPSPVQASPSQIQETINSGNKFLEKMQEVEALQARLAEQENRLRMQESQLMLKQSLAESILPNATKKKIETKFANRIFEASELQTEVAAMLDMMTELAKEGIVRGHGAEKLQIDGQITEAEKVQAAFDMMFDLDIDPKFGKLPRLTGIREAYEITTRGNLMAGVSGDSKLGKIRVTEHAPIGWSENIGRIQEADTTTASFSYLLGTSMNKRLLKDYQAWPAEWQKFCTIVPIRDFKQQTRVRLGAFGSLPIVAEDTAYQAVTIQDSAATYVPQKRGNLVTVSREAIINDDLQAIKQIPTKLAVAAAYTLAEFVYAFLSTNPNIYDGNALFTSGAPHSNLGSSALSSAAMQTGVTAMREQTNFAGKRIGLRPRFLIVPPELEWVAVVATKSAGVPGSNNNDLNPMLGYVSCIVSPQLSNASQWFMAADPREIDTIEVGFVGGMVNPQLFIQDQPLFGLNFTSDAISYKIRHEYGSCVCDYRGLYRGV